MGLSGEAGLSLDAGAAGAALPGLAATSTKAPQESLKRLRAADCAAS